MGKTFNLSVAWFLHPQRKEVGFIIGANFTDWKWLPEGLVLESPHTVLRVSCDGKLFGGGMSQRCLGSNPRSST